MSAQRVLSAIAILALLAGCRVEDEPEARSAAGAADTARGIATALASGPAELSPEDLEAGRLDPSWRSYVDTAATEPPDTSVRAETRDTSTSPETWDDIRPETVNASAAELTVPGDGAGPSIARAQILLDLARFSPGVIDGRWGKNTEKAVYWFQRANDLSATGRLDRETLERLSSAAGVSRPLRTHTLTDADVAGRFVQLPEDVYERADAPCLCYESLRERLGEVFHVSPELLEKLNPDVDLDAVAAGDRLAVPAVEPFHLEELPEGSYEGGGEVARIVISDGGHYLHALDSAGTILHHFPSTLGSDYAPSPSGRLTLESIIFDPTWHYQPELLTGVDPSRPDAVLPAGPNNAVGVVWMQLSREHYGIHGTSAPETIGYATSHGCVRLTNWDAAWLAQRTAPGATVEFRDVDGASVAAASGASAAGSPR